MHDRGSCRLVACFGVVASVVGLIGCGRGERARLDIEGTVTYEGAPLPAGVIRFEPNAAKGNQGPVGIAAIVNGAYTTAAPGCRGAVPGPLVAVISGFPAANPHIEYQPPLFSEWQAEVNLAPAGHRPTRLDFAVPKQGQP